MSPVDFEIEPPPRWLLVLPLLIGVVFPIGTVLAMFAHANPDAPWPALAPVAVMPVVAAGLAWSMFLRKIRLSDQGLRIRVLPWPRTISAAQFLLDGAEVVDLRKRPELTPFLKVAGSRMPSYRSGHFRMRDKRWASVVITDPKRVLVLPLRDGSLVMLSVTRPDALLQALRRQA
jgi:hypothetical protein